MDNAGLREDIIGYAKNNGADIVGFAAADTWDKVGIVPPDFRPAALWPATKTVIVLGIGMLLPILETTPSIVHTEMYRTVNRALDKLAFDVARYLNRRNHASTFFPRDGYGSIEILKVNPRAAFSHRAAAIYAGLGTAGVNQSILTPEFGCRARFVSVFTSAELEPDKMLEKDLCINCHACSDCCPVDAIIPRTDRLVGDFDVVACTEKHAELTRKRCYPCGICIKVCPVGADRKLYRSPGIIAKYRREAALLAENPEHPDYKAWQHIRRFGRWP